MRFNNHIFKLLLVVLVLQVPMVSFASDIPEYKIKASFIYNFARFTQWPDEESELRICLYGKDPFGSYADSLDGKIVGEKKIKIVRTQLIEEVKLCHIVFLNIIPPERHLFERALNKLKGTNVLTIADADNVVDFGVMIGLEIENNKIGFKVNGNTVQDSELKISSQLLTLAKDVI